MKYPLPHLHCVGCVAEFSCLQGCGAWLDAKTLHTLQVDRLHASRRRETRLKHLKGVVVVPFSFFTMNTLKLKD